MAIKIEISNTVGFKVRGHINNESGVAQPFDFALTCERLTSDMLESRLILGNDEKTTEFLVSVIKGWTGVKDAEDQPVPYSPEAFARLCKIPGVANVTLRTYLAEVGAKEKN